MAILETRHQTDLEKRLQFLRRQVYGKQGFRIQDSGFKEKDEITTNNFSSDLTYLYHDLFKILIFASLAIGLQVILKFFFEGR